jgi:hypothetical protein
VSAERWERSLRQLYATADLLEAGIDAAPVSAPPAPPEVLRLTVPHQRSTARVLAGVAIHSAVTVGVLLGAFAIGDPYLPHAERPHLGDRAVSVAGAAEPEPSIPPFEANRP